MRVQRGGEGRTVGEAVWVDGSAATSPSSAKSTAASTESVAPIKSTATSPTTSVATKDSTSSNGTPPPVRKTTRPAVKLGLTATSPVPPAPSRVSAVKATYSTSVSKSNSSKSTSTLLNKAVANLTKTVAAQKTAQIPLPVALQTSPSKLVVNSTRTSPPISSAPVPSKMPATSSNPPAPNKAMAHNSTKFSHTKISTHTKTILTNTTKSSTPTKPLNSTKATNTVKPAVVLSSTKLAPKPASAAKPVAKPAVKPALTRPTLSTIPTTSSTSKPLTTKLPSSKPSAAAPTSVSKAESPPPPPEPSPLEKTEAQRNRTAQLVAAIRAAVGLPAKSVSSSSTKLAANALDVALPQKVLHKVHNASTSTTTPPTVLDHALSDDANTTECSVQCGDGSCVAAAARCNQLVDCQDGADERGCACADYLRAKFMHRKLCDGVVDCWDYSDESNCDWCEPGRHVCSNSRVCIERTRLCDGQRDCPYGDDERQCLSVAPDSDAADDFVYHNQGFVMVRRKGRWGKLCAKGIVGVGDTAEGAAAWGPVQLGDVICRALSFSGVQSAQLSVDGDRGDSLYFETASNATDEKRQQVFVESECPGNQVFKVACQSLLCGQRPQVTSHWARSDGIRRGNESNLTQAAAAGRRARIVGGSNSGPGAWPWQAALYKEGEFQCGATLISDRWLLSAGHCFYHALDDFWVARLGALRRGTDFASPYEQLRPLAAVVLHPGYVDAGFINDISLLRMREPVAFSDYIRPICLPPSSAVLKDGTMCTVVGWGQLFEVGRVFPDTLQEVQLPTISTAECRRRTLFLPLYRVTDNMFCAGFDRGGRDACLGDSGGPLMCQEPDGRWTLHGVTSNGYGCARADRPGVYTKVVNYVRWMQTVMEGGGRGERGEVAQALRDAKTACHGHRCPLGQCLPSNRVCNGFIECSDGSDERGCW